MKHTHRLISREGRRILIGLMTAVLCFIGLPDHKASAQAPTLPDCHTNHYYRIASSPFFDEDRTVFIADEYYQGLALWRSIDDTATWSQVYSYYDFFRADLDQLVIAPVRSENNQLIIYLHYTYGGSYPFPRRLLRSTDTGESWQERTSPCPVCVGSALSATDQPDILFVPRLDPAPYFGYPQGIARSEDGGLAWQAVWDETGAWGVTPSPNFAHDQTVFAWLSRPDPVAQAPIIASFDGGTTWEGRGAGLCDTYGRDIAISPNFANDQAVLVAISSALFRSLDAGLTWQPIYPPNEPPCEYRYDTEVTNVRFSPDYASDHTMFMNTPGVLWVSYDDGIRWQVLARSNAQIIDFSVRRQPADVLRVETSPVSPGNSTLTGTTPFIYQTYLPVVNSNAAPPYQLYLPLLLALEPPLHSLPLTLFVKTSGSGQHYYRSDDGGVIWSCLNLPPAP